MSTVKATRITLVVDEGWLEVIANHHSVVEPGEVFTWESGEPVEVEVEDVFPEEVPFTITFTRFEIDPTYDFEIHASVKIEDRLLLANLTIHRDEDEADSFSLMDTNGHDVWNDLWRDQIQEVITERVWEARAKVEERTAGEVQRALLNSITSRIVP